MRTALLKRRSDLVFSVSATTRASRPGETEGRDYRFIDRETFESLVRRGDLLEWAEVHGELYGTPAENLRKARDVGVHLLLDIDVQGARQLRRLEPAAVMIFLLPPDRASLVERLQGRGSESVGSLRRRLRSALAELESVESFDYAVVNDDLEETLDVVEAIITAERHSVGRLSTETRSRVDELGDSLNRMLEASEEQGAEKR